MDLEREIKVRDAIKYCIENFDSKTATNRIVEFWKDELKLQQQQCNIANVVGQSEQLIMYKLQYFKSGDSLCGNDLENKQQVEHINLQQVSSLSGIKKFLLPLSGTYKGDYAVVSMQNGDRYYIDKAEHSKIAEALNCA